METHILFIGDCSGLSLAYQISKMNHSAIFDTSSESFLHNQAISLPITYSNIMHDTTTYYDDGMQYRNENKHRETCTKNRKARRKRRR
jgi:hypothetical protein